PWRASRRTVLPPKRRERLREGGRRAVLEEGVSRMIREGRPGVRMEHPLDDRAVASGGLPPNPTPGNAVLRFDVRDDFVAQVVIVLPRRGRIDVLVAADSSEAVDHRDDHSPHLPGSDVAIMFRLMSLFYSV